MKHPKIIILAALASIGAFSLAISAFAPVQEGYVTNCLITTKKGYNKNCEGNYAVTLENTCDEKVDIMIAIKKENGRWYSGVKWGVGHRETFTWSACSAEAEYQYWAKPAGSSVKFPKESEITD